MESRSLTSADPTLDSSASTQWYAVWTPFAARASGPGAAPEEALRGVSAHRSAAGAAGKIGRRSSIGRSFPGYCFVRFDAADTLPVLKCTGVVNIVSFEGKPAPIPDYELESIRLLVDSQLQYDPCPLVHEGMMVEVVHGPLRGVVGRLMRKDKSRSRLVLSVD